MFSNVLKTSLMLGLACSSFAQTLTAEMIQSMGNNSLFTRWRPVSHFIAPSGWMNDPCGPMYDPKTKLYHMHYQWHPNHADWGNISWGHASSPDLVSWTDVDHSSQGNVKTALVNGQAQSIGTTNITSDHHTPALYNKLGIFSGTAQPINLAGQEDGSMLAFYTSVSRLPFSWDQAYPVGAESQSYALSKDGGVTWTQYEHNPVLPHPPGGWNVTGWRDPFFLKLPQLDAILGYKEAHFYTIFGAGINGSGPRIPLYSTPTSNMTAWKFLGALWEPEGNSSLGDPAQTLTYGYQFEVPNFFDLDGHWFTSGGIQGGVPNLRSYWNEGTISARSNGSIEFKPISGGGADWGNLYAITSFNDTKHNRRIQIGWSPEDSNEFAVTKAGYQGCLSLPKRLFVMKTGNVVPPKTSAIGNSVFTRQSDGSYTARTLGARAARDVVQGLRKGSQHKKISLSSLEGKGNSKNSTMFQRTKKMGKSYEASVVVKSATGRVGLTVGASPDFQEYTSIYYDPATSTVACERLHSSLIKQFSNTTYTGHFEPYKSSKTGKTERIHMRLWVDGSLIELSINDRFWMTSRIYPAREDSTGFGVYAASGAKVEFSSIEVWDGLANVWPHRPLNSSSLLVYDTPEATNNYTWWNGY